jgi:imidazole glycerol phosphate synthase glutamine amidotransferase subunit
MRQNVYVVDHGVGNTVAIMNLLRKLGFPAQKIESSTILNNVDYSEAKFILPGVGSFDAGMASLNDKGLARILVDHASSGGHILGICLGMQLLFESSEEGSLPGLGIIPGRVIRMASSVGYRIPHVGWERIDISSQDKLFDRVSKFRFYHNHSFALASPSPYELASIKYSDKYAVAVRQNNVVGVQFHPEKSHSDGQSIFVNYLSG